MQIKIIAIGKIKEKCIKEAIKEYEKRLSSFCKLSIIEIEAQQILDDLLCEKYKEIEAQKIMQFIKLNDYVITLEIKGKKVSSEEFAKQIKCLTNSGISEIAFIIGGANGLDKKVSNRANFKLSFSDMTFTHQLIRLLLAEQIYRAFKINANEPYHR